MLKDITEKSVKTIPATLERFGAEPSVNQRRRRVAGYARVSTEMEEQQSSYAAQIDYYTAYIQSHSDWELAGIYTDEGISATNTRHREGFNNMVRDALGGKIDLIITKSVSRFARNTVDSLTTVRNLKDKGVEVYFEKENIWTLDSKGELLITIMSSLAQEESRSISENVTWGHRKRFADGKVSVAYSRFLGYDKNAEGALVINHEEAETVRLIYRLYLNGLSTYMTAKRLTELKIPTPCGNEIWCASTIRSILTNEKYKGDALLQKSFTVDYLTKKRKRNEGEVPQYYVEHSHEPIISPELFEMVQLERRRRAKNAEMSSSKRCSGVSIFSGKIKCGDCGHWYGSRIWHSNLPTRKVVFQCGHKYLGEKKCTTPFLRTDDIKALFVEALNSAAKIKDEISANLEQKRVEFDNSALLREKISLQSELETLNETLNSYLKNDAKTCENDEYCRNYNVITERLKNIRARLVSLSSQISANAAQDKVYSGYIEVYSGLNGNMSEFDENLWGMLVDCVTIYSRENAAFRFKDGTEIELRK